MCVFGGYMGERTREGAGGKKGGREEKRISWL